MVSAMDSDQAIRTGRVRVAGSRPGFRGAVGGFWQLRPRPLVQEEKGRILKAWQVLNPS